MLRGFVLTGLVALLLAAPASAAGPLQRYADDTWRSFDAMTDTESGLPADRLT